MKFQKALIALYLLVQVLLLACLYQISQLKLLHIILALLTITSYLLVCTTDPGYLIINQLTTQPDEKQQTHPSKPPSPKNQPTTPTTLTSIPPQLITDNINCIPIEPINQLDENIKPIDIFKQKTSSNKDSLFCTICMINQPYRTKHCHQCQKCVATHDHHCPWTANCVGQKNRHYFFVFLTFQTIQILILTIYVCFSTSQQIISIKIQWILGIILIFILCLILGLTIFHAYLMTTNITTWELARWDRIPYLNKLQKGNGSPFSKGIARNIAEYWIWGFRKGRKIWEFEN